MAQTKKLRSEAARMADDFYIRKSKWLECVGVDLELSDGVCRLVLVLAKHLNHITGDAFPAVGTLARETGHTERNVRRMLKSLVERGHLIVSAGGGRKATNRYRPAMRRSDSYAEKPGQQRQGLDGKPGHQGQGFDGENPDILVRKTLTPTSAKPNEGTYPLKVPIATRVAEVTEDATFAEFAGVWLFDLTDRREAAEKAFERLSAAERRQAVDRAPVYLLRCAERGERRVRASLWVRERGWRMLDVEPSTNPNSETRKVWVRQGSREWGVCEGRYRAVRGNGPPTDKRGGWRDHERSSMSEVRK